MIFELCHGGQPFHPVLIPWEHLESLEGMKSNPPQIHRSLEDNV